MSEPLSVDLRSHVGSATDLRFSVVEGQGDHYSSTGVIRRAQKGRLMALRDEPTKVPYISTYSITLFKLFSKAYIYVYP